MNSKEYFFNAVLKESTQGENTPIRVLELGCGTAFYVPEMIRQYQNLTYIGVEPIDASYKKASETLKDVPRTELFHQLGYQSIEGLKEESADIVVSFSALEHVKQLDQFMELGAKYLKKGGLMVHRYDLGHALYPGSLKERVHVWCGNTFPSVLPERKFVRYLSPKEVARHFERLLGSKPYRYTYHQMPNQKWLEKEIDAQNLSREMIEEVYVWELKYAGTIHALPDTKKERLFPTVALWGKKV